MRSAVEPTAEDRAPLPTTPLPVTGVVLHDLFATPSVVSIGPRRLGEIAEVTVSLSSRTGRKFNVREYRTDSPTLGVEVLADRGSTATLRLRQTIAEAGQHTAKLKVESDAAGTSATLELPVSYVGIYPTAEK